MKTYWDYTDKERSAMTEDQVRGFLDCELMSKGVLKPEPLKLEPVDEIKLPTTTFYRLKRDWRNVGDIVFTRYEDALAVARMDVRNIEGDYQTGREFASPVDSLSVVEVQVSSDACKAEAKAALVQEKERKERNKKAQEAFDKATEAVTKASSDVWSDWHSSRSWASAHQRVVDTLTEYTKLAGGDERLAATFLAKAFSEDQIIEAFAWFEMEDPRSVPTLAESAQEVAEPTQ
jgi:hypothetical protein